MDFTRVPESVIYKRKTIDKLASEHPFNATLIKHLMTIDGWEEVDPERVVAPCINTAYYMCTIMRMEYDASFRLQSYRYIARRGYVEGANSLQQCVILSIVALLIRHSTPEWRIKLEDIADNLYVYAMGLKEIKTTYHGREIVCDLSLVPQIISRCIDESVVLPDELFQPRFIDDKVILDLKRNEVTFNWDRFISRYSDDEINELVASLGKTQIEKATLIKSMWIDIYNIRKKLELPMQPIFSQLQSAAKEFCPDYLESTGLFPSQSNNAAKESSSTTGKEVTRIRELEEKLNKQEEENNSLKERIKELEEKEHNEGPEFEKEELAFLDDWQKLTTREFAIFFSQALGVSFNPKLINQQQLANLAAKWTEPKPDTIRTKIGNLFQEETKVSNEQLDSFSQKTKDEAMNVYMYILKVAKYYSSITPKMHTMLDNIEQIYGLNIDEERKKKIFETIEKERNSGK